MTGQDLPEFIALVPAGGSGSRMGAGPPKQYRQLAGDSMIMQTVQALLAVPWMQHVYIVVAQAELKRARAAGLDTARSTCLPLGGASRRDSVLAGLQHIAAERRADPAARQPWVMVHDAARPGLSPAILAALQAEAQAQVASGSVCHGALVALPVVDTVKRAQSGSKPAQVAQTVERDGLWLAQTPQVFPLLPLIAGLQACPQATDEASAMEQQGLAPVLVPGHWHNMKITLEQDLELMAQVLTLRQALAATAPDAATG